MVASRRRGRAVDGYRPCHAAAQARYGGLAPVCIVATRAIEVHDRIGVQTMDAHHPSKQQVIELMRRLGMHDRVAEAERDLPDIIDLERDGAVLARLGLSVDAAVSQLGGSAW
jgi:hypothetical protein